MSATFKMEGWDETVSNLATLPSRATRRNVVQRALKAPAEFVADRAAQLAPTDSGFLGFSVVASPELTKRHKGEKVDPIEMYIGPAGGIAGAALVYASFVEFGTVDTPAQPFLRPAWEGTKHAVLDMIRTSLQREIEGAAARIARKTARLG